ncbi:MAG: hydrogenase iron-sulfur subunit [Euryarchaeota archaeon]|nr:hydrogenase iron-sulfur subunit [Euryarchaeota archaeon]
MSSNVRDESMAKLDRGDAGDGAGGSEKPRVGVYLCRCGGCVSGVLDLDGIAEGLAGDRDVKTFRVEDMLCTSSSLRKIRGDVERKTLNRVVIGACSPRIYQRDFQAELEQASENGLIVEMANLREQCAWIHWNDPAAANAKAWKEVAMALAKIRATSLAEKGCAALPDYDICDGCGICASICRLRAIQIVDDPERKGKKVASVDAGRCDGCGACVAACPSGAMDQGCFSNRQMLAQIDVATGNGASVDLSTPNILVFSCNWCSYAAADLAGTKRLILPTNYSSIRTMCSARVDPEWVLRAFSRGIDGVLVLPGKPGRCHHETGNLRTRRRIALMKRMLGQLGFDENRLTLGYVDADDPGDFQRLVSEFVSNIQSIGPSPLRSPEAGVRRKERTRRRK